MHSVTKICSIDKCQDKIYCRGWCQRHYGRWKLYGRADEPYKREMHGLRHLPEYNIWVGIKERCHNPNTIAYKDYGEKGIKVHSSWIKSFATFYDEVGSRPSDKHWLDRIDNTKGYEPGNCKWSTPTEQANNRHNNLLITIEDETHTLAEWVRKSDVGYHTARMRITHWGWTPKRALGFDK